MTQTIACFLPDEKEDKAYGTQKDRKGFTKTCFLILESWRELGAMFFGQVYFYAELSQSCHLCTDKDLVWNMILRLGKEKIPSRLHFSAYYIVFRIFGKEDTATRFPSPPDFPAPY